MTEIAVVVPNWNGRKFLEEVSLPSLAAQTFPDYSVVVVDNGSTDDSVAYLRSAWPEVEVIELPRNLGFAGAVNAGIASSSAPLIALVNTDVELDSRWLEELFSAAVRRPGAGSFACKILDYDRRDTISTVGDRVSAGGDFFWTGHRERDAGQYDVEARVFSACAAAALYRREAFDTVGWFDEDFFAYAEDVDWGFRAQITGYECWRVPAAVAYHIGGATSSSVSGLRASLIARNAVWLIVKNFPSRKVIRNIHRIAYLTTRRFYHLARDGDKRQALRSLRGCLRLLPAMMRKRRRTYTGRRVDVASICSMIEDDVSLGSAKLDHAAERLRRMASVVQRSNRGN